MAEIRPKDVLAALASFQAATGIYPLKEGHIQDVAVETHASGAEINVHVDDTWGNAAPADEDREALRRFLKARFPEICTVRVILRSKEQAATARKLAKPGPTPPRTPVGVKMIAVVSGKGGVGKSTVSIHLAHALAQLGYRTAILDCDIYGFSIPDLLQLRDPVQSRGRQLIPPRAHAIDVMSMKFFVEGNDPVMWRGPMLGKAIRQMMEDTLWNDPQYMVLDLPPGTGDTAIDVHQYFPQASALLVTTPDANASRVAQRAGHMARNMDRKLLGVVENMSYWTCPECGNPSYPLGRGGADSVAASLHIPVLAKIPWVFQNDVGVSGLAPEGSLARDLYCDLAHTMIQMDSTTNPRLPTTEQRG